MNGVPVPTDIADRGARNKSAAGKAYPPSVQCRLMTDTVDKVGYAGREVFIGGLDCFSFRLWRCVQPPH